jgi:hypothetical protein
MQLGSSHQSTNRHGSPAHLRPPPPSGSMVQAPLVTGNYKLQYPLTRCAASIRPSQSARTSTLLRIGLGRGNHITNIIEWA